MSFGLLKPFNMDVILRFIHEVFIKPKCRTNISKTKIMNIKSILFAGFAVISLAACQKEVNSPVNPNSDLNALADNGNTSSALDYYACGNATTVTQKTGNNINIGSVRITNNFSFIEVTYSISNNWILDKTRIYIGTEANIPLNSNGTPKISQFPYQLTHPWDTEVYTLRIPRGSLNGNIVVVAQADVLKVNKITCGILDSQCSYGEGNPFPNTTTCTPQKIYYTLQTCTDN